MTVKNWYEQRLGMDFDNICVLCSDIDMVHVTCGGKLVIGEIKYEKGTLAGGQRHLLTQLVDQHKSGGAVLFIEHNVDVHKCKTDEEKVVNIAECEVKEYYMNGKWFVPYHYTTVNQFMDFIESKEARKMGATIEGKAKVWVKDHDWGRTYTVSVSSKDKDGNWVNAYQPIRFKNDVRNLPENGTEINYKGFATVSKGKEHNYVLWQITEFSFVGNEMARPVEASYSQLTENDIPF